MDKITDLRLFAKTLQKLSNSANLTSKTSKNLMEALIFRRLSGVDFNLRMLGLSIYAEFCLQMLDNKYFDRLRELLEFEVSRSMRPHNLLVVMGLIRKIARS